MGLSGTVNALLLENWKFHFITLTIRQVWCILVILALGRLRQENQDVWDQSQLNNEFKTGLDYMRYCLKTNKQTDKPNITIKKLKRKQKVMGWRDGSEVQFPAPTGWFKTICNSSSKGQLASTCTAGACWTDVHKGKMPIHIFLNLLKNKEKKSLNHSSQGLCLYLRKAATKLNEKKQQSE